MPILNIDTKAVVVYTNKLEKLRKSALPIAIRTTLNSAAFDVKKNTMPRSAQRFIHRTENFFKANSRVEMANGFDMRTMQSVVGFTSEHLRIGSTNFAVKDLEQQEYSGKIGGKAFIPLDTARSGGNNFKVVSPKNRLSKILKDNKIFSAKAGKSKFVAAVMAAGEGGLVLGNRPKEILWRVDSISGSNYKITPLYSVKSGRSVRVGETGFMRSASLQSAQKLEEFYIKAAQDQFERALK